MEKISPKMYARRLLGTTAFCLLSFSQVNLAAEELELASQNSALEEVATEATLPKMTGEAELTVEVFEATDATETLELAEEVSLDTLEVSAGDELSTVDQDSAAPEELSTADEFATTELDTTAVDTDLSTAHESAEQLVAELDSKKVEQLKAETATSQVTEETQAKVDAFAELVTEPAKVEAVAKDVLESREMAETEMAEDQHSDEIARVEVEDKYRSGRGNYWHQDEEPDEQAQLIADLGEQVVSLRAELERVKEDQLAYAETNSRLLAEAHKDDSHAMRHNDSDQECQTCGNWSKPSLEVHGTVRFDVATMCRTPQFGSVIQPATVQIPQNKDLERRHGVTFFDARASSIYFVAKHNWCDTDLKGKVSFDFDPELDVGGGGFRFGKGFALLSNAYVRADFQNNSYVLLGLARNLITVPEIANPLKLNICDLHGPAGFSKSTQPQIKVGAHRQLDDDMGEIHGFVGAEQQRMWRGLFSNGEIALRPANGDALAVPLFAAGLSWENYKPLQIDVRAAVSQNRYAIGGTDDSTTSTAWMAKGSIESYLWGPTAYFSYSYFDGMGRMFRLAFPDAILDDDDRIQNVKGHAYYGGVYFDVEDWFSCNVAAGWMRAKGLEDTAFRGDMYNQYKTVQVGVWRDFCEHYSIAGEYKRWFVKAVNGDSGDLNLFMGTFSYFF